MIFLKLAAWLFILLPFWLFHRLLMNRKREQKGRRNRINEMPPECPFWPPGGGPLPPL
ncbi:MAG: hypothetical protein ACRELF_07170 [Gemmataceae bacterium]